jgi:hypothetical protein
MGIAETGEESERVMDRWFRRILCNHQQKAFVRNIYGDEIILMGYKRSIWRCKNCDKLFYEDMPVGSLQNCALAPKGDKGQEERQC